MATGPSISRRVGFTALWTIIGCLFFYVTLVVMSLYSKGTTLETMTYNAWPRMASRATGAITTPFYVMSLLVSPASLWSLFFVTWTICSHLVHLMILATDTKVFAGDEFTDALKEQGNHPVFELFPTKLLIAYGIYAYVCMLFLGLERTYGPGLGNRVPRMNLMCRMCHAVVFSCFMAFFVDRLAAAFMFHKAIDEKLYPIGFLLMLLLGGTVAVLRHSDPPVEKRAANAVPEEEKKTN